MEHLLRRMELLNVLRQAMLGCVYLAAGFTDQGGQSFDITIFSSKLAFGEQHGQLAPYDASMILRK